MPGIIGEVIQTRNLEIVNKFYGNAAEGVPAKSYAALSKEYGFAVNTIRKIIESDRERNGPRERAEIDDRTCRMATKPLSQAHALIGHRVSEYITKHKLKPTTFGAPIGLSRFKISQICIGVYDLSLKDIQGISKLIAIPVAELCSPKENHVAH